MTVVRHRHHHRARIRFTMSDMADSGRGEDTADVLAMPQTPDAIELRHLRAFVAVAEELNFGRAATRLYLSQPALSRQIRALERLLGCDLLRRSTHRVELTLAGEAFLDRARTLLGDLDSAIATTRSVGGELINRVNRMWAPLADEGFEGELGRMRAAYEGMLAQVEMPADLSVVRGDARAGGDAGRPERRTGDCRRCSGVAGWRWWDAVGAASPWWWVRARVGVRVSGAGRGVGGHHRVRRTGA